MTDAEHEADHWVKVYRGIGWVDAPPGSPARTAKLAALRLAARWVDEVARLDREMMVEELIRDLPPVEAA
jgi:hypothetical protein